MTNEKTLTKADLRQFTSSEKFYRHALVRSVFYTGGVKYVAENGDAYWLIDEIAFAQRYEESITGEAFQLWTLTVHEDRTATLICEDGDGRLVFTKAIECTDFPLVEITFYCINSAILLPSEY